jgi:hypothetical protein
MLCFLKISFILAVAFASVGCNSNTGHSLSTEDRLELRSGEDWKVTWDISAPVAQRDISKRLKNPKWNYSLDGSTWRSLPLPVNRVSESALRLSAVINAGELVEASEILCYISYVFDGDSVGADGANHPRVVAIITSSEQGGADQPATAPESKAE